MTLQNKRALGAAAITAAAGGTVPLLGPGEDPPFAVVRPGARSRVLIVCDHARNTIPAALGDLGLDAAARARHIAWDIGGEAVARELAARFRATLVLACYSRLVVDINRYPDDPGFIPERSDGVVIPGNRNLSPQQVAARRAALFDPYHAAVKKALDGLAAAGRTPVVVSIHSFTPRWQGRRRPWHVGVLWDRDQRVAAPLLRRLRDHEELCVGDNQPYHACAPLGYTMDYHARSANRVPHALIELRQDLIADARGAGHWAALLEQALRATLADPAVAAA